MSETKLKCKKFESVAPDGGWGFLICIAAVIVYTITGGFYSCFGMMYNDFMAEIGMGTSTMALVTGFNAMSIAVSGFLTSLFLKIMTVRQLAFIAATMYSCGVISSVFAHSVITFFICQTLFQSFGFGVLYNLVCTIVNEYFVKRRLFAIGIIQTAAGVFTLLIPLLVKSTLEKYDYRGIILIISAISLHLLPAVALMQPVKWHMKKVEIFEEISPEMELLLMDKNEAVDLPTVKITGIEQISKRNKNRVNNNTVNTEASMKKQIGLTLKGTFKEIFDVTLMKSFLPSYACLGLTLVMFGDYIYAIMIPQALYAIGWSQDNVALAMFVIAFGDLAARITFILFSKWLLMFGSAQLHLIGPVTGIAAKLGMLLFKDLTMTLIFLVFAGVSRCFVYTLMPIVIADEVGGKFTTAMGMYMLMTGVVNLGCGPVVGAIRDLTESYDTVSWISNGFLLLGIVVWCIEKWYRRYKQKEVYVKANVRINKI